MCVVFIPHVPHAEQHTSMTTDSEVLAPSHLKSNLKIAIDQVNGNRCRLCWYIHDICIL